MASAGNIRARWEEACSRLGVKPRQFAVLLATCTVAIGALGAKTLLKPRGAAASVAAPAAARPDPSPAAAGDAPAPATAEPAAQNALRTIPLALEVRPARDPFRPFFLVATPAPAAGQPDAASMPAGPPPKGLVLRAIVAGEFAVINDETLAVGDAVTDGDGTSYVIDEIQERRVVLREGGRRAELGYASTGKKRPQTGTGGLSQPKK